MIDLDAMEAAVAEVNRLWQVWQSELKKQLKGIFDIETDRLLCNAGTHYFCIGHLSAVPLETQSENQNYCQDCYNIQKES